MKPGGRQKPRGSTNTLIFVGPGGPYARDPGVNKYIHVCGARAPYAREPGTQQRYTFMWGPGGRMPGTPGGDKNTRGGVGQGLWEFYKYTHLFGARRPASHGPREVYKYAHLCWARGGARTPMTSRGRKTCTFMWFLWFDRLLIRINCYIWKGKAKKLWS